MAHQAYITGLESCRWFNDHSKRTSGPPDAHRSQLSLAWDPRSSPSSPAQSQTSASQTASRRGHSNVDLSWDNHRSAPSEADTSVTASRKNQQHTTADFTSNFSWQATPNGSVKDTLRGRPERFLKKSSEATESCSVPASSSAMSTPSRNDNIEAKHCFRSPLESRISPTTALGRDGYFRTPESAQYEEYSYAGSDEESIASQSVASEQGYSRRRRHRAPPETSSLLEEASDAEESVCSHSVPPDSIAGHHHRLARRRQPSEADSQVSQMRASATESQLSAQWHRSSVSVPVDRPRPGTPGFAPQSKGSRVQRGPKASTPSVASSCSNTQFSRPSSSIAIPARVAPGGELVPSVNLATEKMQKLVTKPRRRGHRTESPMSQQCGTPSRVPLDLLSVHSERSARSHSLDIDPQQRTQGRRGSAASSCSGSETERSSMYWEGSTAPTRSSCVEDRLAQPASC
mmetsp:Transcript_87889/g.137690  ORF Transcript_87889/g.137690 Transcript_87889/m.137690 type:complete len:460 (+) Transcript_87889:36-1415(+)